MIWSQSWQGAILELKTVLVRDISSNELEDHISTLSELANSEESSGIAFSLLFSAEESGKRLQHSAEMFKELWKRGRTGS